MLGLFQLDPEEWKGWAAVAALYSSCLVLHLLIPWAPTDGYVVDAKTGRPLQYRNNGLVVHLVIVAAAALLVLADAVDGSFLYTHYWAAVRGALVYSLVAAVLFFIDGKAALAEGRRTGVHTVDRNDCTPTTSRPVVADDPAEFETRSNLKLFVLGIRFNPRPRVLGGADFKMMLYVLGANMLHLVILSAACVCVCVRACARCGLQSCCRCCRRITTPCGCAPRRPLTGNKVLSHSRACL
jgi:hypothetical protein